MNTSMSDLFTPADYLELLDFNQKLKILCNFTYLFDLLANLHFREWMKITYTTIFDNLTLHLEFNKVAIFKSYYAQIFLEVEIDQILNPYSRTLFNSASISLIFKLNFYNSLNGDSPEWNCCFHVPIVLRIVLIGNSFWTVSQTDWLVCLTTYFFSFLKIIEKWRRG